MKGLIILLVIVVLVVGGGYVIFTATSDVVVQDESPLKMIKDSLGDMDVDEREEFDNAVDEMRDKVVEMDDNMDSSARLLSSGDFNSGAHGVEGKALLIDDDGDKIVRFENFDTINGPALYIYLSSDLGDDDFIDLGEIKATKGNVNYDIPDGTDTDKYNKVLVWCRPFGVLFSYAELK